MKTKNQGKIKVLKNGPYEVKGNVPLNQLRYISNESGASIGYEEMEKYSQEETYHLCRCGHSNNKPFCDGTHNKIDFDGRERASHAKYEEMIEFIEGIIIDLMDAESLCAVGRFCDTYGSTWNLVEAGTTKEDAEIAVEQCANCPSGRLTAVTKEGEKLEPNYPQEISTLEDYAATVHGPIWVKGGISIEDENGNAYPIRNRVTLCRCGKSQNKPFCDAQHLNNQGELDVNS